MNPIAAWFKISLAKRALIVLGLPLCAAILSAFAFVLFFRGEPFRMTLTPSDGRTVVQFAQPGQSLLSEKFTVDLALAAPQIVELRSDTIPIPGITVEFLDATFLPGRFTIRMGGTLFDVMPAYFYVNGKEHGWHKAPP